MNEFLMTLLAAFSILGASFAVGVSYISWSGGYRVLDALWGCLSLLLFALFFCAGILPELSK